jgi:hypothetical protein
MMKLVPLTIILLLVGALSPCHGGAIVIGGFGAARVAESSPIESPFLQEMREAVVTAFPGSTFVPLTTLTPAAMSSLNVVMVGSPVFAPPATTLSPDEQTALMNFILSGRGAIIYLDNTDFAGGPNESFLEPFGMHITGKVQGMASATSIAPDHPVMNGENGIVTTFVTEFGGYFDDLGQHAGALATYDVNGEVALAAIPRGALGPGSGAVVFIGDADALVDSAPGGLFQSGDNKTFLLNSLSFAVPEPSAAMTLMVCTLMVLGQRRAARKGYH